MYRPIGLDPIELNNPWVFGNTAISLFANVIGKYVFDIAKQEGNSNIDSVPR